MTMQEQLDKFADSTKFSVEILCSIAKRQGKEEMQSRVKDALDEMQTLIWVEYDDEMNIDEIIKTTVKQTRKACIDIVKKHTGVSV